MFVCFSGAPHLASEVTTCSKCGRFCFYTTKALAYARQHYGSVEMRCEVCSSAFVEGMTDAQIREGLEVGRAGLPTGLKLLVDGVGPEAVRVYFRKKRPQ